MTGPGAFQVRFSELTWKERIPLIPTQIGTKANGEAEWKWLKPYHEAKLSLQQSRDCVRAMGQSEAYIDVVVVRKPIEHLQEEPGYQYTFTHQAHGHPAY